MQSLRKLSAKAAQIHIPGKRHTISLHDSCRAKVLSIRLDSGGHLNTCRKVLLMI